MHRLLDRVETILASALLPAIAFLSFSPPIIRANAMDIAFDRQALHLVWLIFFISTAAISALTLLSSHRARRLVFALLAALVVNVLLWNGAFSHVWLNSAWMMAASVVVEISIFGLCLWLFMKMPFRLLARLAALFAALVIAVSIPDQLALYHALPEHPDRPSSPHRPDTSAPVAADSRFKGNVYHIVLDAFDKAYLSYRVGKRDVDLSGYTFYSNATSNYGRTNTSMRSVFSGDYNPAPVSKWESVFNDGMSSALRQNGVSMQYFPFYSFYCDPSATVCHGTDRLFGFYRRNIGTTFVADILFQSVLPISLRNYLLGSLSSQTRPTDTWDYGFSVSNWARGLFDSSDGFPKWRQSFQSLTMDTLDDFLSTEAKLPAFGRYVYLHMMVPHNPIVFDPSCNYVPPEKQNARPAAEAEEDHFSCAITVIGRITQRLKELNRLEDSLVVFHADHGGGAEWESLQKWDSSFALDEATVAIDPDKDDPSRFTSNFIHASANIAMLVHRPGQTAFETSDAPVQLIDVAPTILDHFDLDHSSYRGVSLLSGSPPADRVPSFFATNTADLAKLKKVAEFFRIGQTWQFKGWRPAE